MRRHNEEMFLPDLPGAIGFVPDRFHISGGRLVSNCHLRLLATVVCTENLIRIDGLTESPNDNALAVLLPPSDCGLTIQVKSRRMMMPASAITPRIATKPNGAQQRDPGRSDPAGF